jgi:hypothetical protein
LKTFCIPTIISFIISNSTQITYLEIFFSI